MGATKSHHFVPQFYLRRFSDDGRSIRLLNKASSQIIERASIKGQCAVDNLHGWHDDAEHSLGLIESECAVSIDRLLRMNTVPRHGSNDYTNILLFIALQHGRTVAHAEVNNSFTDHFYKQLLQGRPEFADLNLDAFVINDEHPVAIPIATSLKAFQVLSTLDSVLLSSGERMGFVTSDNPVVLYNSMRAEVWWEGVTGLDCEGLQIFLPLSRDRCLYLFDRAAYSNATNSIGRRASVEDVLKINALTVLNSHKNVYGATRPDLDAVAALRTLTVPLEGFERAAFVETEPYDEGDGKSASIIAIYRPQVPASFEFRFARIRRGRDLDGIRSDRLASSRRKQIPESPHARQVGVASSTLTGPRELLRDNAIRRLARSMANCFDYRSTPGRRAEANREPRTVLDFRSVD